MYTEDESMKNAGWIFLIAFLCAGFSDAQVVVNTGDRIELKAFSDLGVPLHADAGQIAVSGRLPHGSVVSIEAIDSATTWVRVTHQDASGWITRRYVGRVLGDPEPADVYVVGAWNLEHFHDGATRGFPENTRGGPSYPERTQADYETIASIIEDLELRILALSEINARTVIVDGEEDVRSRELERLIDILGADNYDYVIGESGRSQHVAILYDLRHVRLNAVCECDFPEEKVNGKNLFDRQPIFGHFTLLDGDSVKNDLVVVAVHLASGQRNAANHRKAMKLLVEELAQARLDEWCIPADENDVIIMGDFNANRFDDFDERFWDTMESNGWDVLADDPSYPATRLSGTNPLKQRNSKIDYIIITKGNHGLASEEISAATAKVHDRDLLSGGAESFRRHASDHLPVTVEIAVTADTDR